MVDNVTSNLGSREEEGVFSSQKRCFLLSMTAVTVV